jgi:hypothetical protein
LESDCIMSDSLNDKSAAELQELLEMCDGILIGLATEWAGLHHHNEARLDLETFNSFSNKWPDWDNVS